MWRRICNIVRKLLFLQESFRNFVSMISVNDKNMTLLELKTCQNSIFFYSLDISFGVLSNYIYTDFKNKYCKPYIFLVTAEKVMTSFLWNHEFKLTFLETFDVSFIIFWYYEINIVFCTLDKDLFKISTKFKYQSKNILKKYFMKFFFFVLLYDELLVFKK